MQALQTFNFNSQIIKVQNTDGQIWFCGADVARTIGYKNGIQAVSKNISSKYIREISLETKGRKPVFISEAGLYELILKSSLPSFEVFQRWVYKQVLHSTLTIESMIIFLLTLKAKEVLDSLDLPFKANNIVTVDYGNFWHKAIVLDSLQNLVYVKFLASDKNGFVVASQILGGSAK